MVGAVSARDWKSATAWTFAKAYGQLILKYGQENIMEYGQMACPNPADGREQMVKAFLSTDCTHLIFFDDDMKIVPDTFIRLLDHDKACVGIDYAKKRVQPYDTTACMTEQGGYRKFHNMKGLHAAGNMGFGACCVQRWVLEKMKMPRFGHRWDPKKEKHTTEDTVFFENMISYGIQPYVDLDLSWECAHIGDAEFTLQEIPVDCKQVDGSGNPVSEDKRLVIKPMEKENAKSND